MTLIQLSDGSYRAAENFNLHPRVAGAGSSWKVRLFENTDDFTEEFATQAEAQDALEKLVKRLADGEIVIELP